MAGNLSVPIVFNLKEHRALYVRGYTVYSRSDATLIH